MNTNIAVAIIGAVATVIAAMMPMIFAKLRKADEQQKNQQSEILRQGDLLEMLYEAVQHNLTDSEYKHLKNLDSDAPGYNLNEFLPYEMIRLYQHGFVEETEFGSTGKMKNQGNNEFNLKNFYRITSKGKKHMHLIERLQAYQEEKAS
jgi:hypothetical protein